MSVVKLGWFSLLALLAVFLPLQDGCNRHDYVSASTSYSNPTRFEKDILKFEEEDARHMPPAGALVCAGSSSIRKWRSDIAADLAPSTVIPRGFGGSTMGDLLYYADRIILKYKPAAVLIYEGDNDIAAGVSPADVAKAFRQLVKKIHEAQPDCRIYILSIKPSIKRWEHWDKVKQLNESLRSIAQAGSLITYIDVATPMLGADGKPRPELYEKDELHMNRAGYELWRDIVQPAVQYNPN